MRNSPFWWIFIGLMVLLDLYFFQAIKTVSLSASPRTRTIIFIIYWVTSAAAIIVLLLLPYLHLERQVRFARTTIFAIIAGLFFAKLVGCLFLLVDDIRRAVEWMIAKFSSKDGKEELASVERHSRSAFISWMSIAAGIGLYGTLISGFGNKYRYKIRRVKINFPNLPGAFKGMKIVQLSDIHSGSLTNKKAVQRGIDRILREKPDIILFTGDLVNNRSDEMDGYMDVFNKLNAPMGVYSILGNHDYGDYVTWDHADTKKANLERMVKIHEELGWRLLMNEHVILKRGEESIALIGIENWSAKARFPKYGNLKKAHVGTENYPFKILMSHDPSHWRAEVLDHFRDIDLMLSGHTHGMQFGVEIPGLRWSPVQYFYKEWAGLYEYESQKLYVNRGFGFIGYPGRVGIMPEITVFQLS